jgi:hypothetical protein
VKFVGCGRLADRRRSAPEAEGPVDTGYTVWPRMPW